MFLPSVIAIPSQTAPSNKAMQDLIFDMMHHSPTAYIRRRKFDGKLSREGVLRVPIGLYGRSCATNSSRLSFDSPRKIQDYKVLNEATGKHTSLVYLWGWTEI